jgi:capsule polysaccharide modification protein KpsS
LNVTPPYASVRRALLLQGPMGPFLRRFADELLGAGIGVVKVNFNAGDGWYFPGPEVIAYRGRASAWASYFEDLVRRENIDALFLFGDGRPLHRIAIEVAKRLQLRVFVFEEGYVRPDWITLEEGGVNGHSSLPRDPAFYKGQPQVPPPDSVHVGATFGRAGWYSTVYSVALTLGFLLYPHYRHHRPLNCFAEAYRWVLGWLRKLWFQRTERATIDAISAGPARPFYLVALQVHCDYQLVHSPFATVEEFLERVLASFAQYAPEGVDLVVKHHPLDRPYRDYGRFLARLAQRHGIASRVIYLHDPHLPTLLRKARGAVMINSTVGLQSLHAGTPVKLLGDAIYDMPGMTYAGTLDEFWRNPGSVDTTLERAFRSYLLRTNQANGSFYRPLAGAVVGPSGVRWP